MGASPDPRAAPQPAPAARRHPRGDAALREPATVARRDPLPAAAWPVRPPDPAAAAGHPLPPRSPSRVHPCRCQIPAAAGPPAQLRLCRDRPRHPLCHLEILADRRAATAAAFLERFLASFPLAVHTILTDNGS